MHGKQQLLTANLLTGLCIHSQSPLVSSHKSQNDFSDIDQVTPLPCSKLFNGLPARPFPPLQSQSSTTFALFTSITLAFLLILEQMPRVLPLPGLCTCAISACKALPPRLWTSLHSAFCLNTSLWECPSLYPRCPLPHHVLPLYSALILFIAPGAFICLLSSSSPNHENLGFLIGVNFTFREINLKCIIQCILITIHVLLTITPNKTKEISITQKNWFTKHPLLNTQQHYFIISKKFVITV